MSKVKITILKTTLNEDLAKEYGVKGLSICPSMKEGQVFYADYAKPEGFCDEACEAIYQYVFALANGSNGWYFDDWMDTEKYPGTAIVSCNGKQKLFKYLVFSIQKVSLQDFTIDAYINFKSNILYSFGKE